MSFLRRGVEKLGSGVKHVGSGVKQLGSKVKRKGKKVLKWRPGLLLHRTNVAKHSSDPDPYKHYHEPNCSCIRPTLLVKVDGQDDLMFDPNCALVLTAMGEKDWTGRWRLTEDESIILLKLIDVGSETPGKLTLQDITTFVEKHKDRASIRLLPGAVRGLMNSEFVEEIFCEIDNDDSGAIDLHEWEAFIAMISYLRLVYLHQKALGFFKAFWGRNQSWTMDSIAQSRKAAQKERRVVLQRVADQAAESDRRRYSFFDKVLQVGPDDMTGWFSDLYYHSSNNHALHGIFSCDPSNRLSLFERLMMEVATVLFTMIATNAQDNGKLGHLDFEQLMLSGFALKVTIIVAGYMWWYSLNFLYTTPWCGQADQSVDSPASVKRAAACANIGDVCGHLAIVAVILLWIAEIAWFPDRRPSNEIVEEVLVSRCYGYILQWITMVCVCFNPLICCGSPDEDAPCTVLSMIGDSAGLGQWSKEKQRFQTKCVKALTERLKDPAMLQPPRKKDQSHWFFSCCTKKAGGYSVEDLEHNQMAFEEVEALLLEPSASRFYK